MTPNEPSMPVTYKEEWEVRVDRVTYTLNERQLSLLKDAMLAGQHGMVWFDKFAISIPHISSIALISREKNQLKFSRPNARISEEDREAWRKFRDRKYSAG